MKTIPEVREDLLKLAADLKDIDISSSRKIKSLVKNLYRRPAVRRAGVEHVKVTPLVANTIRGYALSHPRASYALIGKIHNVSIGRVSEVLAGKRAA